MSDPLEKVIRPIVEGQIRGFLKEHPAIVHAVDWYKKRADKATTLTNSLAKRIILDLLCPLTRERIEGALFEIWETENSGVARFTALDGDAAGMVSGPSSISTVECSNCGDGDQIGSSSDLVALALRAQVGAGTYQPGWMETARAA